MIGVIQVKSTPLSGVYNKTKLLQIVNEEFDTSNPKFTQIKNSKSFQIELSKDEFRIRKIDKIIDASDPTYMALTQIKGVMKNNGQNINITLSAEIHMLWFLMILIGLIIAVVGSIFIITQLIGIISGLLMMYVVLRYLAYKDFERFVPFFEGVIKEARSN